MICADSGDKIFGWTFDGLQITAQQYRCEALYASGRIEATTDALRKLLGSFGEEINASQAVSEWVMGAYSHVNLVDASVEHVPSVLKKKCVSKLEALGDEALDSGKHDSAIAQYTLALSIGPADPTEIFVKRSKARAAKGLWGDALVDANEVRASCCIRGTLLIHFPPTQAIKLDPSSHRGYERKFAALHGAEDYDEANNAFVHMFSIIENSAEEEVRSTYSRYSLPHDTDAMQAYGQITPLRVK